MMVNREALEASYEEGLIDVDDLEAFGYPEDYAEIDRQKIREDFIRMQDAADDAKETP